ncbi:uncharacterized protein Eif4a1l [Rattus norvegicus]|uniref:uncharacterized protein Eif4a1l n=1 Tax=Rattus norvegicus TaxID=10116 RepID=UPI001916EDE7|nr:uncharacterized protein LOC120095126 [Rattus norvegicus]
MASPSHTSGRSPPKESGPAHPQFANCPACAAKWTRPPGAGWAPGASRGRSFGLGSVLAVKKTSTPNGRFLLPRPTFQARRRDSLKTQAPLLVASGTARILRNPRAHALPNIGRQPDQPAPGRTAASSFSHVMSRPHLAFQYPSFAYGIPTGRGLVTNLAPSALSRPSFPVSTLVSASAMGFPPPPRTVPPGSILPQPGRFGAMGLSTFPRRDLRKGAAGVLLAPAPQFLVGAPPSAVISNNAYPWR